MRITRTRNNSSHRHNYRIACKRKENDNFFSGRDTTGPAQTFFSRPSHGVQSRESGIQTKTPDTTKPKCISDPAKFTVHCPDKKAVNKAKERARTILDGALKKMRNGPIAVPEDPRLMKNMQKAYVLFFKVDQGGSSHRQISQIKENFDTISRALNAITLKCASKDCCDCKSGEMLHNAFALGSSVYLCPVFFKSSVEEQARTIIHELAHAKLGIGHAGGRFLSFSCGEIPLKSYDDAIRNAYAYDHFAYCLYHLPTK